MCMSEIILLENDLLWAELHEILSSVCFCFIELLSLNKYFKGNTLTLKKEKIYTTYIYIYEIKVLELERS